MCVEENEGILKGVQLSNRNYFHLPLSNFVSSKFLNYLVSPSIMCVYSIHLNHETFVIIQQVLSNFSEYKVIKLLFGLEKSDLHLLLCSILYLSQIYLSIYMSTRGTLL